jgi:hypothetical protein
MVAKQQAGSPSIFRGAVYMVDDEVLDGASSSGEPEAQLFFEGVEKRGPVERFSGEFVMLLLREVLR